MNLTEAENFLVMTLDKIRHLQDLQAESHVFKLPTDDARRSLTGLTGVQFDLRQLHIKLHSEQRSLKSQLDAIDALIETCNDQCVQATSLATALMANTPPA